jgi:LysM repeat protein
VIRLKKKLLRSKNPLYKIAREFGITHTQLNRIRKGENWGHVKVD